MAQNLPVKNITLNDILHNYNIGIEYNSYDLTYYATQFQEEYDKYSFTESTTVANEYIDSFNRDIYTYNTSKIFQPYSLIIANNSYKKDDNNIIIENSYVMFYNSTQGLYQLSYIIQEGNGLYNDPLNHILTMNIDNRTIRDLNNRLYFNTNSIPDSTSYTTGIYNINHRDFDIDSNGIISVNQNQQLDVITLKHDCKMIYININSLYNELNYLYEIQQTPISVLDSFSESSTSNNENSTQQKTIKTHISYQFITPKIKYCDNYYKSVGLIPSETDISIELDDSNIIYTKNIDLLDIIIDSNHLFDNNHLPIYNDESKKSVSSLIMNYKDTGNIFNLNTSSKIKYKKGDYCYTLNNIDLKNKIYSQKLFKKYGVTLNIKLQNDYIYKSSKYDEYYNYLYYSSDDNIKVIYDDRNIENIMIFNISDNENSEYYYMFSRYLSIDFLSNNWNFLIKSGLIWKLKGNKLYLGYATSFKRKEEDNEIYNKKYYPIWQHEIGMKYLDINDLSQYNPMLDYNDYPEIGSLEEYKLNSTTHLYSPIKDGILLYRITKIGYRISIEQINSSSENNLI